MNYPHISLTSQARFAVKPSSEARLATIAAICGGVTQPIHAAASEVAEEAALAKSHDDEQSTLDESDNVTVISPLLAERVEEVNEKMGAESLDLSEAERKEVGPLVRFKNQPVIVSDESPVPQDLDYEALAKWADEMTATTEAKWRNRGLVYLP